MKELRNAVCIVGVDESDEIGTLPHRSQLTLHVEAVRNAVRDAGLRISDIDGVFTAGHGWWWVPIVGPCAGAIAGGWLYDACVGKRFPGAHAAADART